MAHILPYLPLPSPSDIKPPASPCSTLSRNTIINDEIGQRISKASQAFDRLQASMWQRHGIHLNTKLKIYKAVVFTTLTGDLDRLLEASQETESLPSQLPP
ncbi:unnamed protein product [Schistocephalus solidus]|uniref:Uncharacterized protein n=1 Tax=Schistocephalus solidus TaxID=70667 RepID=A0A183SGQ6_SCHSO|nr:unnamed protein product [Schistocephalus solidus]